MINFPTYLTFTRYPRKVRHYVVYSTSDINVSISEASSNFPVTVSLIGKYGDNLYEIALNVPNWTGGMMEPRTAQLRISNAESETFYVSITQTYTMNDYVMDADVNVAVVTAAGGNFQIYFSAYGENSAPENASLESLALITNWNVVAGSYSDDKYPCLGSGVLDAAPEGMQMVSYVTLRNASTGAYEYFAIVQNPAVTFPVWKDTFVTQSALDEYVDYTLRTQDSVFFKGRAYYLPGGSGNIDININRTLEYYLPSSYVPSLLYFWKKDTNSKTFSVQIGNNVSEEFFTWGDYSYEDSVAENKTLSHPINGVVDLRQWFVTSFLVYGDNPYIDIERDDYLSIWADEIEATGNGIYNFCNTFDEEGRYKVYNNGVETGLEYKVTKTCADYCLIYLNKYGGYDTFLVNCTSNGKYQKTDNWQTYQTKKSFRNTTSDFRTNHYLKDITSKWLFHTCWLTDAQASRMDNLLESNRIFLQDLNNPSNIVPVVITDTSLVYKTYSNQGNKLVSYDINVEESQNKIRR